jgi:ABC-type multidrug transport system permease subunit
MPQARLLVADLDDTAVSGLFVGALNQGPLADLIEVVAVDPRTGERRMNAGEAAGFITIPEGFAEAVFQDEPLALPLVVDPSDPILPGILVETFSIFTDAVFFIQRILGEPLRDLTWPEGPPDPAQFTAVSATIGQVLGEAGAYLFPPAIELEVVVTRSTARSMNFGQLFLPSMLMMAMLFVAQGHSLDLWKESDAGTLRRTLTTPARVSWFLLGKLAASAVTMLGLGVVALLGGRFVFGIPVADFPGAALWTGLSGALLLLLFMAVQVHATSARGGGVLTGAVIFPLAMLGGSFFPFEAMPDWLAAAGRWTPNGWALVELKRFLQGTGSAGTVVGSTAFVLAACAVLFLWIHHRLTGRFAGR